MPRESNGRRKERRGGGVEARVDPRQLSWISGFRPKRTSQESSVTSPFAPLTCGLLPNPYGAVSGSLMNNSTLAEQAQRVSDRAAELPGVQNYVEIGVFYAG